MDWAQAVAVLAVIVANLGTVIILYCHLDNKTEAFLRAIAAEMKDFHGKLCALEERNRK